MRPGRYGWLAGMILLSASPPVFALDPAIGECTKTFQTGATGYLELSEEPSKLCSLDCLSTASNGWAAAWDTPDTVGGAVSTTHTQAKVVAEKGNAAAYNSSGTGETARFTEFGLLIESSGCIATGSWKD